MYHKLEMTDDAILSREAFLIYQYALGFEPENGNLTRWIGYAKDASGSTLKITVIIPKLFPNVPPVIHLPPGVSHPAADQNGQIKTRTCRRWKNTYHVYTVIREAIQLIRSNNVHGMKKEENGSGRDAALQRQIETLKSQLSAKKQEYEQLLHSPLPVVNTPESITEVVEESLLNLENDLYALEDSYDNLEIDDLEFAKKFLSLQKRYYMISEAINKKN